jgi:hypothetical protein
MTDGSNAKSEAYFQGRFEAVRGKADIKGHTDELMSELRDDDRCCLTGRNCPGELTGSRGNQPYRLTFHASPAGAVPWSYGLAIHMYNNPRPITIAVLSTMA